MNTQFLQVTDQPKRLLFSSVLLIGLALSSACEKVPGFRIAKHEESNQLSSTSSSMNEPILQAEDSSLYNVPGICTLSIENIPNNLWENSIAFDPVTSEIVHSGGHLLGAYSQSGYTYLYHTSNNKIRFSKNNRTGPRQCLQDATYVDSLESAAFAHGNTAHGSMPPGDFINNYTGLGIKDVVDGPWFFNSINQSWSYARPIGNKFERRHHSPIAYDSVSDTIFSLSDDKLVSYHVRTNQVFYKAIPTELHSRFFYAIAVNPLQRSLVVHGGRSKGSGMLPEEYDAVTKNDTWIYKIDQGTWVSVESKLTPPKGMPGVRFSKFSAVYDPNTGLILLRITPLNRYEPNFGTWPDAETWALDLNSNQNSNQWKKVQLTGAPPFQGLMVYDSVQNQLIIVGGERRDLSTDPISGRNVYRCTMPLFQRPLQKLSISSARVISEQRGLNHLDWTMKTGSTAQIFRAEESPFPSAFSLVAETQSTEFNDLVPPGKSFTYFLKEKSLDGFSLAGSTRPKVPLHLLANVLSDSKVNVSWDMNKESDVIGYNVYRSKGSQIQSGTTTKLNKELITANSFEDLSVDLSDKIAQFYFVTAVNKAGLESGKGAWASTFPEAPLSFRVDRVLDRKFRISWILPEKNTVKSVRIYFVNNHLNLNDQPPEVVNAWYDSWTQYIEVPSDTVEYIYSVPDSDPITNRYFILRAVNVLNQEGFRTDLLSPTDWRFPNHGDQTGN